MVPAYTAVDGSQYAAAGQLAGSLAMLQAADPGAAAAAAAAAHYQGRPLAAAAGQGGAYAMSAAAAPSPATPTMLSPAELQACSSAYLMGMPNATIPMMSSATARQSLATQQSKQP